MHTRTHVVSSVCVIVRLMGVYWDRKWLLIAHSNAEDTATKLHLHNTELNLYVRLLPWNGITCFFLSLLSIANSFQCVDVKSYLFKEIDFLPSMQSKEFSSFFESAVKIDLTWNFLYIGNASGRMFLCFYFSLNLCFPGELEMSLRCIQMHVICSRVTKKGWN